jgi:hypothetical protein
MSRWQNDEWAKQGRDEPEDGDERADGEEDDLDDGTWELDPNDPAHPDHDLSVAAGYATWEPAPKPWFVRRGVILFFVVLVILALIVPVLLRFGM